ncbi:ATP-binding cassette sub-family D member 3 isoform X1 [Pelobates cultripes]|uniref:ATP-binding cassette sub-family D member 3 isoform X1 n=1 Tax=Pelobates cultripes TaxID=61616 RepID=A0AAD1STZ1_PELCU|nr:ATP-binding cassette sub-family D member 3 isoform X1 [Pelobates cultripes]
MGNLDNRIANADQLLTQDVERFCNSVVDLYSNLSKPFLDIVLYIFKLTSAIGAQGPASMMAYLLVSGLFLTRLRRPIGKMTIAEQRYEGEYRYVNSRLITNSEEIAFYNGNEREKQTIHTAFNKLVEHLHNFILFRFSMGFVDSIIAKYLATVVGYLVVSRPFLTPNHPRHLKSTHAELLEDYYQSGRMLLRMSQALGRIVLAGREMTRLAGFTARITELMQVLKDLNRGKYERTMISQQNGDLEAIQTIPLIPGSGKIINADNIIKFDHVPLATPNGDILIRDLDFEVKPPTISFLVQRALEGPPSLCDSLLLESTGWAAPPLYRQSLVRSNRTPLSALSVAGHSSKAWATRPRGHRSSAGPHSPARPDSQQQGATPSRSPDRLGVWVAAVHPETAWSSCCHNLSAVPPRHMCGAWADSWVGITLFTVSHRKSLWKHHEYYLHMDGRGNYEFKQITDDTIEFGS